MRSLPARMIRSAALAGASTAFPALLVAQTCIGAPQLAGRIGNVGAAVAFYDGGQAYTGEFSLGSGMILMGDYSYEDHSTHTRAQNTLGVGVGYEFADQEGRLAICPAVWYSFSWGIYEFRTKRAGLGIAIGVRSSVSDSISIVPFGRISAVWSQTIYPGPDPDPGWSGLLLVGARVETNRAVSLGPLVSIPFAADDGAARFGIGVGISLLVGL